MSDREASRAEAANHEGLGDPGAETQRDHGRIQEDRPYQEALKRRSCRCVQQVTEHGVPVSAALVAPGVLVEVALQPADRDAVVDATERVLKATEESLDGLSVRGSDRVHAVAVAD